MIELQNKLLMFLSDIGKKAKGPFFVKICLAILLFKNFLCLIIVV